MKKFVVVLLALALVFGLATTAMAADTEVYFPDVDDQSEVAQIAIYRLATLGVLEGYAEDGTFRPNGNITRAEFAKICDYLADKVGAISTFATMNSAFSDVKVGSWYNGYVIAAYEYNLVNGYTDGTFGPQRNITLAEAVTMLLRVVGYTNELAGDWPYDYIAAAKDLDVIEDIDFVSNRIATRAEVAIMANEILELIKVQYDPDSITVLSGGNVNDQYNSHKYLAGNGIFTTISNADDFVSLGYDVLEDSFDAYVAEVHFRDEANIFREGAAWGYEDFDENELEMEACIYPWHDDWYTFGVNSKYYIHGGDLIDLGGQIATITFTDDTDGDNDEEIMFVELTGSVVKSYELETSGNSAVKADGTKYDESKDYAYMSRGDADLNDDSYGLVYLDEDGDWIGIKDYHVVAFTDARYGIVTDVNENWIEFNETNHAIADIALNEKYSAYLDDGFIFIKDGEFVEADDIEIGDVIYKDVLSDGDVTYFLVYSPLEGNVEKYRQDYFITMSDDRDYDAHFGYYGEDGFDGDLIWLNNVNSIDDEAFDACTYAIAYAYDGLAYVIGDFTNDALGVIVDAYTRSNGLSLYDVIEGIAQSTGGTTAIQNIFGAVVKTVVLFGEDGEEHEYTFDADYDFQDFVEDIMTQVGGSMTDYEDLLHVLGSLVTVELNGDDEIVGVDVEVFFDPDVEETPNSVSGNYIKHGTDARQYLDDNATIFKLDAVQGTYDSGDFDFSEIYLFDDVTLMSASRLLRDDFLSYQYDAYDTAESGSTIDGLYLVGARSRYVSYDVAVNEYQDRDYDKCFELTDGSKINIDDWMYANTIDYPLLMSYMLDEDNLVIGLGIADADGLVPQYEPGDRIWASDGMFGQYVGSSSIASVSSRNDHLVFDYDYVPGMGMMDRTFVVTEDTKFYNLADNEEMTYEDLMTSREDETAWYVYVYQPSLDADDDCDLLYVVQVNAPDALVYGADKPGRNGQYTWNELSTLASDLYGWNLGFAGDGTLTINDVWEESGHARDVEILVSEADVTITVPDNFALDLTGWAIRCTDEGELHFDLGTNASVTLDAANGGRTLDRDFVMVAPVNWETGDWAIVGTP